MTPFKQGLSTNEFANVHQIFESYKKQSDTKIDNLRGRVQELEQANTEREQHTQDRESQLQKMTETNEKIKNNIKEIHEKLTEIGGTWKNQLDVTMKLFELLVSYFQQQQSSYKPQSRSVDRNNHPQARLSQDGSHHLRRTSHDQTRNSPAFSLSQLKHNPRAFAHAYMPPFSFTQDSSHQKSQESTALVTLITNMISELTKAPEGPEHMEIENLCKQ